MSYILDALKKSDRERKQGEIPDLQSDHGPRFGQGKKGHKFSLWKWLLAGALCGVLALVLYWGMQRRNVALQEQVSALEKSVGQLQKQPVAVAAPAGPGPRGPKPSMAVKPSPPVVQKAVAPVPQPFVIEKKDDSAVPQPPAVQKEVVAQSVELKEETEKNIGMPVENLQPPAIEEHTVIKPENVPRKVQPEVVATPPEAVAQAIVVDKEEVLPLVQDLPDTVKKSLPPLKLAGHVYSKDATKRMIVINNKICREGDLVDKQLYLEQIVWEGVVLRYQTVRFRMNLF